MIWLLACVRSPASLPPDPAPDQWVVATWNVYWEPDLDAALPVLDKLDADTLFLQETDQWEDLLRDALADDYPYMAFVSGERKGDGLAVLSRFPIDPIRATPSPVPRSFREQRVVVRSPLGPCEVSHVHLRPPIADVPVGALPLGFFTTKDDRQTELRTYLSDPAHPPDLVLGDFNANERERGLQELAEQGLRSVLPDAYPQQRTWHGPGRAPFRWRIDHIFIAEGLRAEHVRVYPEGPSDHWPVLAVLAGTGCGP